MAVTTQPGHNQQVLVGVEGHRDFSTGLFGCFTDCGSCECRPVLMALTAVVALLVLLLLLLLSSSCCCCCCSPRLVIAVVALLVLLLLLLLSSSCYCCCWYPRPPHPPSASFASHTSTNVQQDQPRRLASRINACPTRPVRSPCFTHQRMSYKTSQVAMLHASTPVLQDQPGRHASRINA